MTLQSSPAIQVRSLSRSYGELRAVDRVSLDVHHGEVVGLLGPNGAGKTTLLRMLSTLLKPDQGSIHIAGHDAIADPLSVRKSIGYQTGDTAPYARLTVREFLLYFGALHGLSKPDARHRADELIRALELDEQAHRLCANLSTGQRQRVSLARTLVPRPNILIFDEPTSGLDISSAAFILETIRGLADQGAAVLFSTHVMSEVELTCDRICLLNRGQLLFSGPAAELLVRTGQSSLTLAFLDTIQAQPAAGGP